MDEPWDMEKVCDIPINPRELAVVYYKNMTDPDTFLDEHKVIPVDHCSVKPIAFVAMLEMMKAGRSS